MLFMIIKYYTERICIIMIRNELFKTVEEEEEEYRKELLEKKKKEEEERLKEEQRLKSIKSKHKVKGLIKDCFVAFIIAAIACFLITHFVIFKGYVPTGSMKPTLNEGDHLMVTRIYNFDNIKRGDILVFKSDELNDVLVKRVIGLPGDYVVISAGTVSINGDVIQEDYVVNKDVSDKKDGSFIVPEKCYFFLGDNRPVSNDAALWKDPFIPASKILGKVQLKVYPFNEFGSVK